MSDTTIDNAAEQPGQDVTNAVAKVVPMTVAGQRYISPAGRHSKQTHIRAAARAQALGLTTVRELYDYDRAQVAAKLQKGSDGVLAQQKNEQNRRSGVASTKE